MRIFEAVVTGIPERAGKPVAGGSAAEMREAFRQLDLLLKEAGVDRNAICTARLYLQDVRAEISGVNVVWKEYFGSHPVVRRAYGVELQSGMRVEGPFTAEVPQRPAAPRLAGRLAPHRTAISAACRRRWPNCACAARIRNRFSFAKLVLVFSDASIVRHYLQARPP